MKNYKNIKKKSIDKEMTEELKYRVIINIIIITILIIVISLINISINKKLDDSLNISTVDSNKNTKETDFTYKKEIVLADNIISYNIENCSYNITLEKILNYLSDNHKDFIEKELVEKKHLEVSSEDLSTLTKSIEYIKIFNKDNKDYIEINLLTYNNVIESIEIKSNNNELEKEEFENIISFIFNDMDIDKTKDSIVLLNNNIENIKIEQIIINNLAHTIKIYNQNCVDIVNSDDAPNIEDVLTYNNFNEGTLEFIAAFFDLDLIQSLSKTSILSIDEVTDFNTENEMLKTDIKFRILESMEYSDNEYNNYWIYEDEQDKDICIKIYKNKLELNLKCDNKLDLITLLNILTFCFNGESNYNIESLRDELASCIIKDKYETVRYDCVSNYINEENKYNYKITIVKERGK